MTRPTFLGMTVPSAVGVGLAAAAVGVALGIMIPSPVDRAAPCGLTFEEGVAIPAACASADDLAATMDRIRAERSVGVEHDRTTDAARCERMNGAPLTGDGCATYLAEVDAVAAACGHIADGSAWGACSDRVLAAHRAEVDR